MAERRAKIAVSIDARVLKRAERLRARTGETRSALVSRALAILTGHDDDMRKRAEYVEAYRRMPETSVDVEAARELAKRVVTQLPWEDE
jgi:hypothetical protein